MNEFDLKSQIDKELGALKLLQRFESEIKRKAERKPSSNYLKVACLILCFIFGGTTVYAAGNYIYENLMVNQQQLPELAPMQVKNISAIKASKNNAGYYEKIYSDYHQLQKELGISLLDSKLSQQNPYLLADYQSDGENWANIKITAFITGDVSNLRKVPEKNLYTYQSGVEYASPIDMQIDIMTSKEQKETGWERDYLGYYEFVESYDTNGLKVNILKDSIDGKEDIPKYKPAYKAVFVSDGIRYSLTGRVSLEKMKQIVSLLYVDVLAKK